MNNCGSLSWTQLELPSPLPVEAARAAIGALAGLSGQPRLVLEARGEAGGVAWFLGAEPAVAGRAVAAMSPSSGRTARSSRLQPRERDSCGGGASARTSAGRIDGGCDRTAFAGRRTAKVGSG